MKVFDTNRITQVLVTKTGEPQVDSNVHKTVIALTLSNGTVVVIDLDEDRKTSELSASVRRVEEEHAKET